MEKIKSRLIYFFVFAVGCGWAGKALDVVLTKQPKGQSLGSLIWLIAPSVTAIILAIGHKSTYKTLGWKLRLKNNGLWYLFSFLIFPVIAVVIIGLGLITGNINASKFELSGFMATLAVWFVYNFFRTILEETSWRGFLQERLIVLGINDWIIYLITALVWSLWHIPYYLFFYGSNGTEMIISCFVMLFSWSILYSEIYRITRTIWPCVLMHAASNAIQYTMLEHYLVISDKMDIIFSPTGSITVFAVTIIAGLVIRKYRKINKVTEVAS